MAPRHELVLTALSTYLLACTPRVVVGAAPATAEARPAPVAFVPGDADPTQRDKLSTVSAELDAHFQAKVAESRATAAVVGIVIGGELAYARSLGVRDMESATPVDADTVFRIASLTKSFTAAAVMKLRDDGRLMLDVPAAAYVPELASITGPTRDAATFTVRHLLAMASGLPSDDMWGAVTFGMSELELTKFLQAGVTLAHSPGEHYIYSNLGYALLGRIVERVSSHPFREYVTQNLLAPLGMTSTVWEARDVPAGKLATGYRREGELLVAELHPSDGAFAPAGGLYTSLHDYARYMAFQLAAYPPRDDAEAGPLRRSTLREMHQGQRFARLRDDDDPLVKQGADGKLLLRSTAYGFGWVNNTTCDYVGMLQHGGFEPGYFATVHLFPRHRIGIAVLAASGAVGWKSIDGTIALLRKAGLLEPVSAAPVNPPLLEAQATVLRLIDHWEANVIKQSFDQRSQKYSWVQQLEQDFARLAREHGTCRAPGPLRPRSGTEATFQLSCDRGDVDVRLLLAPGLPPRLQMVEWRARKPGETAEPGAACSP